jgi:hypothetical protein
MILLMVIFPILKLMRGKMQARIFQKYLAFFCRQTTESSPGGAAPAPVHLTAAECDCGDRFQRQFPDSSNDAGISDYKGMLCDVLLFAFVLMTSHQVCLFMYIYLSFSSFIHVFAATDCCCCASH